MTNRPDRLITRSHVHGVSTKLKVVLALIGTAIFSLGLSVSAWGQTNPSATRIHEFTGRVVNTEAEILPFVSIAITGEGKTWNTESDERGEFRIALPIGKYTFRAERPRYKPHTVLEVPVGPAANNGYEFVLEWGECNDCEPIEEDQTILEQERKIMTAIQYRDPTWLDELLANDFVHRAPGGTENGKVRFIREITSIPVRILEIHGEELKVSVYGDVAILTGIQRVKTRDAKGKEESGANAFTDVFVKRGGDGWLLVLAYSVDLPATLK